MSYKVGAIPQEVDPWVGNELRELEKELGSPADLLQLKAVTVAPTKVREGMVVFAPSPTGGWDPGSGAGFYGYYSGSWSKLG